MQSYGSSDCFIARHTQCHGKTVRTNTSQSKRTQGSTRHHKVKSYHCSGQTDMLTPDVTSQYLPSSKVLPRCLELQYYFARLVSLCLPCAAVQHMSSLMNWLSQHCITLVSVQQEKYQWMSHTHRLTTCGYVQWTKIEWLIVRSKSKRCATRTNQYST